MSSSLASTVRRFVWRFSTRRSTITPSFSVMYCNSINSVNISSSSYHGSLYILVVKFKDFSRTFNDAEVAFSRTNYWQKFTTCTVLQQCNIYLCDYGTVLVDKKQNTTIISKSWFRQNTWQIERTCIPVLYKCCLTKLTISRSLTWWIQGPVHEIQGLSSTCPVFKYFQGLEFRREISSTFKDFQGCMGTLSYDSLHDVVQQRQRHQNCVLTHILSTAAECRFQVHIDVYSRWCDHNVLLTPSDAGQLTSLN